MKATETTVYTEKNKPPKPAWDGHGEKIPADMPFNEILEFVNLNWCVYKDPMFFAGPGYRQLGVPKWQILLRDKDELPLGPVTSNWEPIQNHEVLEPFRKFVKAGSLAIEAVGSLYDGRIMWVLARTTHAFEVFNGDEIQGYFLFSNSHSYGRAASFKAVSVRAACQNMEMWDLKETQLTIHHRGVFNPRRIELAIAESGAGLDRFKEIAEHLGRREYTDRDLESYFTGLLPRYVEEAMRIVEVQPGAEYAPRTWWQAYNAVSYMLDHVIGRRGDKRLDSIWFGKGGRIKAEALIRALEFAKAA